MLWSGRTTKLSYEDLRDIPEDQKARSACERLGAALKITKCVILFTQIHLLIFNYKAWRCIFISSHPEGVWSTTSASCFASYTFDVGNSGSTSSSKQHGCFHRLRRPSFKRMGSRRWIYLHLWRDANCDSTVLAKGMPFIEYRHLISHEQNSGLCCHRPIQSGTCWLYLPEVLEISLS